ncbi:Nn.00g057390.m01.CDS01 [Neocucurbitaria sp. VM-36]
MAARSYSFPTERGLKLYAERRASSLATGAAESSTTSLGRDSGGDNKEKDVAKVKPNNNKMKKKKRYIGTDKE